MTIKRTLEEYQPRLEGARWVVSKDINETSEEQHFGDRVFRCYKNRPTHFDALLRHAAKLYPKNSALSFNGKVLDYENFDKNVTQLSNGLLAAGYKTGERIGLMLGNGFEFFIATMAIIRMGAIAVPMSVKMSLVESEFIINQCGASGVFIDEEYMVRLADKSKCPTLRKIWVVGSTSNEHDTFEELICDDNTPVDIIGGEEDNIMIFYTSGTTGRPKGACITNLNLVHSALHYEYCLDIKMSPEGDSHRALLAIPAAHISGFMAVFTNMLHAAGCVVIMRDFKTDDLFDIMVDEAITYTVFVPAIYQLILMNKDFNPEKFSTWVMGIYGGGVMPPSTVERLGIALPNLKLINAYGATETTAPVTVIPAWESSKRPNSIGLLVECADVKIIDDNGNELPQGEVGELLVKGPMIVPKYWNNIEGTRDNFTDGYWHTGDIMSCDKDGFFYIHDRKKDMINRGGYKVFSAEVESALLCHPKIIECAAVGVEDSVLGERVCVFLFIQGVLDEMEIRAHAKTHLSDYKQPDFYVMCKDALPRNANGKIMKAPLAEQARGFAHTIKHKKEK